MQIHLLASFLVLSDAKIQEADGTKRMQEKAAIMITCTSLSEGPHGTHALWTINVKVSNMPNKSKPLYNQTDGRRFPFPHARGLSIRSKDATGRLVTGLAAIFGMATNTLGFVPRKKRSLFRWRNIRSPKHWSRAAERVPGMVLMLVSIHIGITIRSKLVAAIQNKLSTPAQIESVGAMLGLLISEDRYAISL